MGVALCGGVQLRRPMEAQAVSPSAKPQQSSFTLDEVIHLAEANEPAFAAAAAQARVAALQRKDARAALLPSASIHNGVIYTEPNGQSNRIGQTANQPSPVFIQNNAVREYASLGAINETLGFSKLSALKTADANLARADAEAEIARRGLVATVVNLFYNVASQTEMVNTAKRSLDEAAQFLTITQDREHAREAAHADVIKAQIQLQQRHRELSDAQLAAEKSKLDLAVLLFADPSTPYDLTYSATPAALPDRSVVEQSARANNPEVRSALASLQMAKADTYSARAALIPEVGINATYGIDAPQFAAHGPDNTKNLGYAGTATLDIPVWDWLTGERKIKESRILQRAARVALTNAQRRALADLTEFYNEAQTAQSELASLEQSVADSRESLRLTDLRYTDGEGTVFEVVDAQNTLMAAEVAQINGKARYELALAQLQTLTGKL
jgi:outer membrane protein TolC